MAGSGKEIYRRNPARRLLGACKRRLRAWLDSTRDAEVVFTEIYRKNIWGGEFGTICSGGGSHESAVSGAYFSLMRSQAEAHGYASAVFVDLGCGDMAIGRELIPLCRTFVGVDVVGFVLELHRQELGADNVRFVRADIVADELPDGDVCFVRQVFQHLSNRQIAAVLPKLRKYRYVYITEHIPSSQEWVPNLDKRHGAGIRLAAASGIDLTAAPFGIDPDEIGIVLDVACLASGGSGDAGVIRTVLYTPGGEFRA
jgi:hypothetical protein